MPICSPDQSESVIMRGKPSQPRTTEFAQWLYDKRTSLGMTMVMLGDRAGVSHARIVQLEKGDTTTRDMVERLARALVPQDLDPDEVEAAYLRLSSEGLRAAGFIPDKSGETIYSPDPDFEVLREAYDNGDDSDRDYLLETARRLRRAQSAQDAAREGAIGRRKTDD